MTSCIGRTAYLFYDEYFNYWPPVSISTKRADMLVVLATVVGVVELVPYLIGDGNEVDYWSFFGVLPCRFR